MAPLGLRRIDDMASTLPTHRLPQIDQDRLALAVADAGWYTTENLFREVPEARASTLLLRCADVRVAWSKGERPWNWNRPAELARPGLWRRDLVLPSGWMKTYPKIGMWPIARAIRRWKSEQPDGPLALVMTYPHYLHLADRVWPDRLVYFNIDDYRLYWPKVADEVGRLERRAVLEADLTVCTSLYRAEELRRTIPEAAERIKHLPHGAPSASIPDRPQHLPGDPPADIAHLPRPLIGYVGTLEDRVDWSSMAALAKSEPDASIVLVGRLGLDGDAPWQRDRHRCLALPNVHAIGWRGQATIDAYNRSFDLGLIPYRVDHPFNVASCPTKIMDYMAAGRPVVATDLPECRLYPELFDVVPTDSFAEAVHDRLVNGPDDGRAGLRLDFARANSCQSVAERLLDWIGSAEITR
jgi:teichuronic acid biosynthesis glycosyltransferase TuaH